MQISPVEALIAKKCVPCEGGVESCSLEHSNSQLKLLPDWQLSAGNAEIFRNFVFKNFVQAVSCFNQIAELAELEAHHPDVHLTGYRNIKIALSTHAIGGLSENDFILAAKIDALVAEFFPKVATGNYGTQN